MLTSDYGVSRNAFLHLYSELKHLMTKSLNEDESYLAMAKICVPPSFS